MTRVTIQRMSDLLWARYIKAGERCSVGYRIGDNNSELTALKNTALATFLQFAERYGTR